MSSDVLSKQFKDLYDEWGMAIANKQYDWFERHFSEDFLGTAQPWPALSVNKRQMIELDKAIKKMDVTWQKVIAHQIGDNVITLGIVKYNDEQFEENATFSEDMPSGQDISDLTRGKSVAYINGWRHNGENWQIFDHHMVGIVENPDV